MPYDAPRNHSICPRVQALVHVERMEEKASLSPFRIPFMELEAVTRLAPSALGLACARNKTPFAEAHVVPADDV